ncbi:hypothetical protein PAXRUDRAFT_832175 [Paxillus rubicundulus Ve08.2h10]|uniref:Uncharacterized protein n=1 Tax=Paxillus rubicundulus Ve08.2h10 TaxID=930991 RepID=A0A0D0DDV7_9AGAM|nr:hypothetical protein PAXRUDRAFT_832175 [Paxillus rubicundulus Ve08.2h10]
MTSRSLYSSSLSRHSARKKSRVYYAEQSTQPQILGYSLGDSPAGLFVWISEKSHHWTADYPWKDDEGSGGAHTILQF